MDRDEYWEDDVKSEMVLSIASDRSYIVVGSVLYPDGDELSMRRFYYQQDVSDILASDNLEA
jgi:hypothetical protein